MRTIALRFSNGFAPECGTIKAHNELIDQYGYVWYGKLGSRISDTVAESILKNKVPMVLLIHSGTNARYWAYVDAIIHETPPSDRIPAYYRDRADKFQTWLRITRIEKAPNDILSHCYVVSSGVMLTKASKHSMSPYFIIDYREDQ